MGKSYTHAHGAKIGKHRKIIVTLIVLMVVLGGALAAIDSQHDTPKRPLSQLVVAPQAVAGQKISSNYGLPTRLQIPKLQIDTHVLYMGLTKDGNMSVPTNVIDVGWYKYGALPGNTGTAVIAGHLDGLRGEPGVFSDLTKLVPGDTILVTESNGSAISFVVREKKSYPQTGQPAEVFNSTDGSHLNLITCAGSWDSSEHRFAERLVVFADKAT